MQTNTKDQVYAGIFRTSDGIPDKTMDSSSVVAFSVISGTHVGFVTLNNPDKGLVRNFIFTSYQIVDIVCYLPDGILLRADDLLHRRNAWQKAIPSLRVVSTEDRKIDSLLRCCTVESIGRFLSGVIMNLGNLLILAQKEHRGDSRFCWQITV